MASHSWLMGHGMQLIVGQDQVPLRRRLIVPGEYVCTDRVERPAYRCLAATRLCCWSSSVGLLGYTFQTNCEALPLPQQVTRSGSRHGLKLGVISIPHCSAVVRMQRHRSIPHAASQARLHRRASQAVCVWLRRARQMTVAGRRLLQRSDVQCILRLFTKGFPQFERLKKQRSVAAPPASMRCNPLCVPCCTLRLLFVALGC